MDLLGRKKLREKEAQEKRLKEMVYEEVIRKNKPYAPSSKKLTIITFILFLIAIPYMYFTSDKVVKDGCSIMPGLECKVVAIRGDYISFEITNFLKEDKNITITLEGCPETIDNVIKPNKNAVYRFECNINTDSVSKSMFTKYVGFSGLPHNTTGKIVGKTK